MLFQEGQMDAVPLCTLQAAQLGPHLLRSLWVVFPAKLLA